MSNLAIEDKLETVSANDVLFSKDVDLECPREKFVMLVLGLSCINATVKKASFPHMLALTSKVAFGIHCV